MNQTHNPEFIVYAGPMFSSKTSQLLSKLERYKYQSKSVLAFKPEIDVRYSNDHIVSHIGLKYPAITISDKAQLFEAIAGHETVPDVIAVDEAFMIDGIGEALVWLYKRGMSIVVSTLDISSTGTPFQEAKNVLAWATEVVKCSAVCTVCGADAFYTHKKVVNDDEIEVGGAALYEPRCYTHHVHINYQDSE